MGEELLHIRKRLIEEGEKTLTFFQGLAPPDWDQQVYTTGSSWRVRQVLAHFISAERAYQSYLQDVLEGGRGAPLDLDIDRFNEVETPPLSQHPLTELIDDLRRARSDTVRMTEGMDESDLARQAFHPWFGEKDLAFFLKLLYRHHTMHLFEVRQSLESGQPNPHSDRFRSGAARIGEARMASIEYDRGYLAEAVPALEDYLYSKEIYWAVSGSPPKEQPAYPRLTLGNVLLSQARLRGWEASSKLSPEQASQLSRLDLQLDALRSKRRVAWGNKAKREFSARLRLWRDFLEEYRENPAGNADRFAYEVGRRVMLQLLEHEADEIPAAELELLAGLDRLLDAVLAADAFVWEPELAPAFPRERYPYLYGKPKT